MTLLKRTVERIVNSPEHERRYAERLEKCPHIREAFGPHLAKGEAPPFHCHPMRWRLATWSTASSEVTFKRLNSLLVLAGQLPGWAGEKGMFSATDFQSFWGLMWQLQVAEFLAGKGASLSWKNPGPDLLFKLGEAQVWCECYSATGAYGSVLFFEEVLAHIHPKLELNYDPGRRLPTDRGSISTMFEECLKRVEVGLPNALLAVESGSWPVLLYSSPQTRALEVRVKGTDLDLYDSRLDRFPPTDLDRYYRDTLWTALQKKQGSNNSVAEHRPNIVFINMAVVEEFQAACWHIDQFDAFPTDIDPPSTVDAAVVCITGIDEKLTSEEARPFFQSDDHPMRTFFAFPS